MTDAMMQYNMDRMQARIKATRGGRYCAYNCLNFSIEPAPVPSPWLAISTVFHIFVRQES